MLAYSVIAPNALPNNLHLIFKHFPAILLEVSSDLKVQ